MDKFYGMNIYEEDQIKIIKIREAIPENIRDFVETRDIQNLLKTNIDKLETQITILFSKFNLHASQQTREAIKKIIYPSQTTKINNNNMNTISDSERICLAKIKNSISFATKIGIDDDLARRLLKADENTRKSILNSRGSSNQYIKLDEKILQQLLKDIKEIADNYKLSYAKNLPDGSKNQPKNTTQNGISSETYATDPNIVKGVSDKFKRIFNCEKDLSVDDVKKLLISDASTRKTVLSDIITKYKTKEKRSSGLFSILVLDLDSEVSQRDCFLSFVDNMISDFHKSQSNTKVILQKDEIFSNQAVKLITDFLVQEYKNGEGIIDFTSGNICGKEISYNTKSRFYFTQINQMLKDGVLPECLLAIRDFDIYIKYQYLTNDILAADISKSLCEQFIEFLYMDVR